ncbi:CenpB-DNA-bind-domain-containing protein [Delitschia confertaspora ATCC 74209]|uniref:CenpB-DNA-bind-domain-containing protein n=1 Tax=Delitschia confertaspora ATCC 74209 TaxID=1513339 RepID=A0A9P4MWS9_9PLEO|nr:CenpB-DNA-bind-domain-containing protein [Delitschia confertaspora ATCC 74209]
MEHEQQQHQESTFHDSNSGWVDNTGYHPHPQQHQSPVQEYNGFNYAPLPMEPLYTAGMHPPRTTHQQLQPLIMPQWPSMLTSQSTYVPPIFPAAPVPITPAAATPVSAVSAVSTTSTRSTSTPRKTLTDADRRRMCLYHEEHPTVKQTEIGAMFGVERSTVSKVLRQKEKYLYQDDGSRSPIRKSKGKFPDIERALSNWARNHQRQGLPLNDNMIREKARFFATTVGNSESHVKANSTSWLEKFKQKNNLMGAKSRKNSIAEESEGASNPPSNAQTPNGISPTSPTGVASPSPITMSTKSDENLKTESPESYGFTSQNHRPFHSASNTSLNSVFTDTAPSSFSAGPTSPTSPFNFTPDSACGPNPFMDRQPSNGMPGSGNFQRPRSQTFPLLIGVEQYMSPPASSDAMTPKYINSTTLESPMADAQSVMGGMDDHLQASPSQNATSSMQPPPVPAVPPVSIPMQPHNAQSTPVSPGSTSPQSPSQEEARRALELVMSFFQQQPTGFVEPQEYVMIGKLMEKLKIKNGDFGAGMRRVSESDFDVGKVA